MIPTQTPLHELQQWILQAITEPDQPDETALRGLVCASRQQTASERLSVYRHAYLARLLGVLRDLFPCTRYSVGDELFDQFGMGYLRAHPPASYTLARLADSFADYLDRTRPESWGGFVVDLARLEQAIDRVFDGPGPEQLPSFTLPEEISGQNRLLLVPGLELLSFDFPVSSYYSDWKAGRASEWLPADLQFVALLRRDYIVRRYELSRDQHLLLRALQSGFCLEDALDAAAEGTEVTPDDLAASVHQWFLDWTSERFFAAVR